MSVDYYMACQQCGKALHVAQDGLSGFTFYSGQPDTMKLLGEFLRDHRLCGTGSIQLIPEAFTERRKFDGGVYGSHGELLPDD